jgi:hypothetical protein
MSPSSLLIITVAITFAAAIAGQMVRRHQQDRLRKLALQWKMNYSPADQFRLTPRVFANFPVPGAAKIRVVDLIYGMDQDLYRYLFTAEYTLGVVTGKRRVRRAGSFTEPRARGSDFPAPQVVLAPPHLPLLDQYRRLNPRGDQ